MTERGEGERDTDGETIRNVGGTCWIQAANKEDAPETGNGELNELQMHEMFWNLWKNLISST